MMAHLPSPFLQLTEGGSFGSVDTSDICYVKPQPHCVSFLRVQFVSATENLHDQLSVSQWLSIVCLNDTRNYSQWQGWEMKPSPCPQRWETKHTHVLTGHSETVWWSDQRCPQGWRRGDQGCSVRSEPLKQRHPRTIPFLYLFFLTILFSPLSPAIVLNHWCLLGVIIRFFF